MQATNITKGTILKLDGKLVRVLEREMCGTAQAGKSIHIRAVRIDDNVQVERRFRAEEKVERAEVERHNMEYLYQDGTAFVFMDSQTFEQFSIPKQVVGLVAPFLKENAKIEVDFSEAKPVNIVFPSTVEVGVVSAPTGVRGGDSSMKEVVLENGVTILAPQFIKQGDRVRIDVSTQKYVDRVKEDKAR